MILRVTVMMKRNYAVLLLSLLTLCELGNCWTDGTKNFSSTHGRRNETADGKQLKFNRLFKSARFKDVKRKFAAEAAVTTHRTSQHQCHYTEKLYDMLRAEKGRKSVKECAVPGCFYLYLPKDSHEIPFLQVTHTRGGEHEHPLLEGCRSDIPYLIQRSESTDSKIKEILSHLRACFVGDISKEYKYVKQCHRERSPNTTTSTEPPFKDTWLERNLMLAQTQCFYPFYNERIFFVNYGGHSEGRVVCCSDGRLTPNKQKHEEEFRQKCMGVTELVYNAYDAKSKKGWRDGKDGQTEE